MLLGAVLAVAVGEVGDARVDVEKLIEIAGKARHTIISTCASSATKPPHPAQGTRAEEPNVRRDRLKAARRRSSTQL